MGLPLLAALNPLQLIGDLVKAHRLNEWAKLLFSLSFSGVTSFAFSCGSALAAHRPPWESFGIGLLTGAVMMTVVFRRSPLTKGMFIALPAEEAGAEMGASVQTIQRS